MMISASNRPRRSTLPQIEELELVSTHMKKEISKLHCRDEESVTVSSTTDVGSSDKRFVAVTHAYTHTHIHIHTYTHIYIDMCACMPHMRTYLESRDCVVYTVVKSLKH